MKYLKKYKLFESIKESEFPKDYEVSEFFYDFTDLQTFYEGCTVGEYGYLYFTSMRQTREIRSELFYDMSFNKNWLHKKSDVIQGDKWSEYFLTVEEGSLREYSKNELEFIHFVDINKKDPNGIEDTFYKKMYENISNGNITAYPVITINFGVFEESSLNTLIECLERFYEVTGFRPVQTLSLEGYVDEETGDIVNLYNASLELYKVNDIEYKEISKIFRNGNKTDLLIKKFS